MMKDRIRRYALTQLRKIPALCGIILGVTIGIFWLYGIAVLVSDAKFEGLI